MTADISSSLSNLSVEDRYDHSKLPKNFIGLNTIDTAPESEIKAFVKSHGGHSVIQSVCLFIIPVATFLSTHTHKIILTYLLFDFFSIGPYCKQWYCCS